MLEGNKCEVCTEIIENSRAQYKQTKYCRDCAKKKKLENTENSMHSEDRKEYMRQYMREYRRLHPKLNNHYVIKHRQQKRESSALKSTDQNTNRFLCLWFLPLIFLVTPSIETMELWYDTLKTIIGYFELIVIKITGLAFIIAVCWQHIRHMLKSHDKPEQAKEPIKKNDI